MYLCTGFRQNTLAEYIQVETLWVHILLVTEWSISHKTKKHIVTKDVVGLLLGELVRVLKKTYLHKGYGWLASRRGSLSTKKKHIVAKDVVGLLVGDSKNDSLTKMKTF
jgi:hypothetical protein